MKQTITLSTAAICFVIAAHAQINKGSILLGGTINGSSANTKSQDSSISKSNVFTIAPALGFAVSTKRSLAFLFHTARVTMSTPLHPMSKIIVAMALTFSSENTKFWLRAFTFLEKEM